MANKKKKSKASSRRAVEESDYEFEEDEFEVESILGSKYINGVEHFHVMWKGYTYEDATWEPLQNVRDAPEKLIDFFIKERSMFHSRMHHPGFHLEKSEDITPTVATYRDDYISSPESLLGKVVRSLQKKSYISKNRLTVFQQTPSQSTTPLDRFEIKQRAAIERAKRKDEDSGYQTDDEINTEEKRKTKKTPRSLRDSEKAPLPKRLKQEQNTPGDVFKDILDKWFKAPQVVAVKKTSGDVKFSVRTSRSDLRWEKRANVDTKIIDDFLCKKPHEFLPNNLKNMIQRVAIKPLEFIPVHQLLHEGNDIIQRAERWDKYLASGECWDDDPSSIFHIRNFSFHHFLMSERNMKDSQPLSPIPLYERQLRSQITHFLIYIGRIYRMEKERMDKLYPHLERKIRDYNRFLSSLGISSFTPSEPSHSGQEKESSTASPVSILSPHCSDALKNISSPFSRMVSQVDEECPAPIIEDEAPDYLQECFAKSLAPLAVEMVEPEISPLFAALSPTLRPISPIKGALSPTLLALSPLSQLSSPSPPSARPPSLIQDEGSLQLIRDYSPSLRSDRSQAPPHFIFTSSPRQCITFSYEQDEDKSCSKESFPFENNKSDLLPCSSTIYFDKLHFFDNDT